MRAAARRWARPPRLGALAGGAVAELAILLLQALVVLLLASPLLAAIVLNPWGLH